MNTKLLIAGALALASLHVQAQTIWSTDYSLKNIQIAKVINSAGNTTGVFCNINTESCDAYVSLGATCEPDAMYPMMLNSALGAYAIRGQCMHIASAQVLVIQQFDAALEAYQSGGEIGFALPMASGAFKVVRFTTAGANAAINAARNLPQKKPSTTKLKPVESL